ncbi:NAD(P)/FAD-dependent oxidoreductase [Altererythrobacter arenosus]|uniref:NAD(P)/FAD-dependent oxidoreductase n=1 Tax=Altererythrobacter arenosus TaxID=3032592 RepID=A0ABY8FPN4_9SPHN|nr:FAD/NAD(P)-binding protein [Altererythrobacter sp. CAU 1644]WFL76070.1 NAD(P)/FAD-dependent oxidoreductase [Altererythrobacter sp. CAU 1644]
MADFETDYLIVGAGAVGLAFADTLVDEDPDCHITFVDKHAKPGGHWNDAYGFVALHQPSATYGVNSLEFQTEHIDEHGPNKGLHALASGTEVLAYFEKVMNLKLLPTGRVEYHRLSEYKGRNEAGDARIVSIFSGEETTVKVRRRIVDATYYQTSVPSTHTRNFAVAGGVEVVPPGHLPELWKRTDNLPDHYVILGAGKTAMDTGVWLIEGGVDPDRISWVRPRESWLWNRVYTQPGEDFIERVIDMQIGLLEAASKAGNGDEWMRLLGEQGYYLKIDEDSEPEMFHYATISQGEVDILRRIKNVIRKGRVTSIERGKLIFGEDAVELPDNTLFIDCTATAVPFRARRNDRPVFDGDTITLRPLHIPLVTFSATVAAFLEANFDDDATRNALAQPGPLTDTPATFPYAFMVTMMNRGAWAQNPEISAWLTKSRLDLASPTIAKLVAENSPKLAVLSKFQEAIAENMPHLARLGMQAKQIHEAQV